MFQVLIGLWNLMWMASITKSKGTKIFYELHSMAMGGEEHGNSHHLHVIQRTPTLAGSAQLTAPVVHPAKHLHSELTPLTDPKPTTTKDFTH